MSNETKQLTRVAVFYDGTYFAKVSKYYKHHHSRADFLTFTGLHEYIRHKVAEKEKRDLSMCQIVESHFFRGRFSLTAAKAVNSLEQDRYLDQLLMYAGIVSHYYPMNETTNPPSEKGIDVWLSLEAYDLAVHKKFDVLVLFTGDQDFVPLIRKINGLGTRVMVIGVDVQYSDQKGKPCHINCSQVLINEATYPILLNQEIDSRTAKGDRLVNGLFER